MSTALLVARHGNTFAPGEPVRRVGARTDLPLVESGREQGRRLGAYLKSRGWVPDRVFTSELKRAVQTAQEALGALGAAVPCEALALFNEIDHGPDEGRPEAEVRARLGAAALEAWEERAVVPDGWRADPEALRRAWLDFGARLAREPRGRTALVVTSAGVARFAPALTGDLEGFRASRSLKLATGALSRFVLEGGTWLCTDWNLRP